MPALLSTAHVAANDNTVNTPICSNAYGKNSTVSEHADMIAVNAGILRQARRTNPSYQETTTTKTPCGHAFIIRTALGSRLMSCC